MAFDVDQFLAQNSPAPVATPDVSDGLPTEADITSPATSESNFDVDNFLKTTQDNVHLPNPAEPEAGYGEVLSKAATNAKLGLMQGIGGDIQAAGQAPFSALQELAQPAPSWPTDAKKWQDYVPYFSYVPKQILAKAELAATAIPSLLAPGEFNKAAETGKEIQQEATAEEQENQPNVMPGGLKSKIGNTATMAGQVAPTLLAAGVAPEAIPALFGAQGFGSTYAEQTNAGQSGGEALLPSVVSAAANAGFGEIPMGVLTQEGGGIVSKLVKAGISGEVASQGINAVQQGINAGTINPNMTLNQFLQSAKDIAGSGAALGLVGGVIAHPFTRGAIETTNVETTPVSGVTLEGKVNQERPTQVYNPETGEMEDADKTPPAEVNNVVPLKASEDSVSLKPTLDNYGRIEPTFEPSLSPVTDVDTAKTTLDSIGDKNTVNLDPNVLSDLINTGHVTKGEDGQPTLTELGQKLSDELNKISSNRNEEPTNISPVETQNANNPADQTVLPNDQNRVGAPENAIAQEIPKPLENRLLSLEQEYESLPEGHALRNDIVTEMNDIVERIPAVQNARAEGLLKSPEEVEPITGKGVVEQATPEDENALAQHQEESSDIPFSVTPTDKFAAQKDNIKQQVTNIVKRINPDVNVKTVDKLFGEGEAVKASGGESTERQEVAGSYDKLNNVINASMNLDKWNPIDTAYHEAYHSIRDMVKPSDDAILKKAFPGTDKLSQPEHEAVEFGRYMTEKNAVGFKPAVQRVFSSIRQAFRNIANTLRLGKFNSPEDIFNRVESGKVYQDYKAALKNGDVDALKNSNLSPEQQEQAVKEVSPALHDIVYSKTPISESDRQAFKDIDVEAHGTPVEKADAVGNDVYNRTASLLDKGLDTVEKAKEKMLRATVEVAKPFISDEFYKEKRAIVENNIAKTKRSNGDLNIVGTLNDMRHIVTSSIDGFGRALAKRYNSTTIARIMDMFHVQAGKDSSTSSTYHEDIANFYIKTMSQVANVLKKTTAKDAAEIRDYMVHPEKMTEENTKEGNGYIASQLARSIQDMRKELAKAGYEVPEVNGFYPRIYDTDYIVKNEAAFKKDAALAYEDTYRDQFQDMYDRMKNGYENDLNNHRNYEQRVAENPAYEFASDTGVATNGELQQLRQNRLDERAKYVDKDGNLVSLKDFTNKFIQDRVNSWFNNITLQDDGIVPDADRYFRNVSTAPDAPSSFEKRTLSKAADDILEKYMVKDPLSAMNKLTMQTARKVAWEKRFGGNKLQELLDAMQREGVDGDGIQHVMDIIRANTGQLGGNVNKTIKNGLALARFWTAVSYLAKAPFKHMSIALNVGNHTGNPIHAFRALNDSISAFIGRSDKARAMKTLGELMGVYGEGVHDSLLMNQMGIASDNQKINFITQKYFDAIGMTHLVGSSKLGMMRPIQYYLADMAEDIVRNKNSYKSAEFMIKNYGVPASEVGNFAKWVMDGGGRKIQQSLALDNGKYSQMYQLAVQRAVNQMISNPTPATRQMYATHPVGGMIYQLSAYHMAFLKNSLERNARLFGQALSTSSDYSARDRMRFLTPLAMTIPVMIGFARAYTAAKDAIDPPDKENKNDPNVSAILDADLFGAYNGLLKDIAGSKFMQKQFGYKYYNYSNSGFAPSTELASNYWKMISNFPNNFNGTAKSKAAEVKAEYNLVAAPLTTAFIATHSPFAIPGFLAIEAINSQRLRRALTK